MRSQLCKSKKGRRVMFRQVLALVAEYGRKHDENLISTLFSAQINLS